MRSPILSFALIVVFNITALMQARLGEFTRPDRDLNTSACADFYEFANGGTNRGFQEVR